MPDKHKKQIKKAEHPNHGWSWNFVSITTACRKPLRVMTLVEEYTRRWLAFHVASSITHKYVLRVVLRVLLENARKHGMPAYIRSDNGPEFIAKMLKAELIRLKIDISYIDTEVVPGKTPGLRAFTENYATNASIKKNFILCSKQKLCDKIINRSTILGDLTVA